jgi:hypothetical protein
MWRYVGLALWPARLSCDYSYAQIGPGTGARAWLETAVLPAGAVLLWRWSRTGFFVAASAFLVFLPGANLLFPIGTIMAERFLYLPAIAVAAGLVWAVYAAARRWRLQKAAPMVLGAALVLLGVRTFARNRDWQDDLTLSAAAVRVSPASFKAHEMHANALLESDASHANIDA